jgi:hypothetical protein
LDKASSADALQVKSVSEDRFVKLLGTVAQGELDDVSAAIALCVGYVQWATTFCRTRRVHCPHHAKHAKIAKRAEERQIRNPCSSPCRSLATFALLA